MDRIRRRWPRTLTAWVVFAIALGGVGPTADTI